MLPAYTPPRGKEFIIWRTLNHRKLNHRKLSLKIKKNNMKYTDWNENKEVLTEQFVRKTLFHIKFFIFNGTFDTAHNTLLTHFQS